jgi:hypothetical protein
MKEITQCTEQHRTCVFDSLDSDLCCAISNDTPFHYVCSRKNGHKGPHIACTGNIHNVHIWSDDIGPEVLDTYSDNISEKKSKDLRETIFWLVVWFGIVLVAFYINHLLNQ